MAANVDAMVREGIHALKEGNKDEARALLMKAVEIDQLNEEGWLWLSAVVDSIEDQATCLENVLAINPSNERARQGMQYIEQQRKGGLPPTTPTQQPAPAPQPHQREDATSSQPAANTGAQAAPAAPRASSMPTSVEWAAPDADPTSSTPSKRPFELSEDEYDSWVNTLNLPTASKPPTDVFVDEDDEVVDVARLQAEFGAQPAPKPAPEKGVKAPEKGKKTQARAEKPKPQPEPEYEPLFPGIPEEIKANRLPGTQERLPILLWLVLAALLSFNIVAAVLLIQRLFPG
jgi:hypothetical protein